LRKIPENIRRRTLNLWLEGRNYSEMATELGISSGSISSILDNVRRRAPDLDELRKLNLWVRKRTSNVYDALRGGQLLEELHKLGTSLGDLNKLLEILNEVADERHIGPEDLVDTCLRLRTLEVQYKKTYNEIVKDFEERQTQIRNLEVKVKKIQEESQKLNTRKRKLEETLSKVKKKLNLATKTTKRLGKLTLEKLDQLAEHAEKEESLDNRILQRQNELESLRRKVEFLRQRVTDIKKVDRILEMRSINIMCPHCGCLTWKTLNRFECENLLWSKIPLIVKCIHCGSMIQYNLTQILVALSLEVLS